MHSIEGLLLFLIIFFSILAISSVIFKVSKRTKIPYPLLLFIVGMVLTKFGTEEMREFTEKVLNQEVIFYIFLPILLYAASYKIRIKTLRKEWVPVATLSIVAVILNTAIIGLMLYYLLSLVGMEVPLLVAFLFASLISATDPVAVLALFKDIGVPKRASFLFEAESLFNDATALAIFLIVLELTRVEFSIGVVGLGLVDFVSMLGFGGLYGVLVGIVFLKLISFFQEEAFLSITLTFIMAHFTFITAEFITPYIPTSPIVATVMASIILGNKTRLLESQNIKEFSHNVWEYMDFVINSLLFILMGFMVSNFINSIDSYFLEISIAIFTVVVARFISIYSTVFPLNRFFSERVPNSWIHLFAWAEFRGIMAIIMLLLIPENLHIEGWNEPITIHNFLYMITVSTIVFSLIVKGFTVKLSIEYLNVNRKDRYFDFMYAQMRYLIHQKIINYFEDIGRDGLLDSESINYITTNYKSKMVLDQYIFKHSDLQKDEKRKIYLRYIYEIERETLHKLHDDSKIDDQYLFLLEDHFERRIDRLTKEWKIYKINPYLKGFSELFYMKKRSVELRIFKTALLKVRREAFPHIKQFKESFETVDKEVSGELFNRYQKHLEFLSKQVKEKSESVSISQKNVIKDIKFSKEIIYHLELKELDNLKSQLGFSDDIYNQIVSEIENSRENFYV